jgi:hypothetical protein
MALEQVAEEWDSLLTLAPLTLLELGPGECSLLRQFGLPCRHHLFFYQLEVDPMPRTLCHPRWWLKGQHG